ncbi:hypothetical protein KDA_04330 [Dictyobacter alpinus]|uniref:Uncharacterized protein n=1 Tax=Dictyobacter alpinus TaxID=2014873 RepID=A0A402B0S7_9CHLR|nr:hypothetical protein KDA_04330 [Dictyobacter alpinus]
MKDFDEHPRPVNDNISTGRFLRLILIVLIIILACLLYFVWPYIANLPLFDG